MTTVIAARVLLKEELPRTFILTALISFGGLTFICQPSFIFSGTSYEQISWEGVLYLLAAVVCWSATCLIVRVVRNEAHFLQLELAVTMQSIFIWCPLLIAVAFLSPGGHAIDGGEWSFSWDTCLFHLHSLFVSVYTVEPLGHFVFFFLNKMDLE